MYVCAFMLHDATETDGSKAMHGVPIVQGAAPTLHSVSISATFSFASAHPMPSTAMMFRVSTSSLASWLPGVQQYVETEKIIKWWWRQAYCVCESESVGGVGWGVLARVSCRPYHLALFWCHAAATHH